LSRLNSCLNSINPSSNSSVLPNPRTNRRRHGSTAEKAVSFSLPTCRCTKTCNYLWQRLRKTTRRRISLLRRCRRVSIWATVSSNCRARIWRKSLSWIRWWKWSLRN
jgi:hypothetical protein